MGQNRAAENYYRSAAGNIPAILWRLQRCRGISLGIGCFTELSNGPCRFCGSCGLVTGSLQPGTPPQPKSLNRFWLALFTEVRLLLASFSSSVWGNQAPKFGRSPFQYYAWPWFWWSAGSLSPFGPVATLADTGAQRSRWNKGTSLSTQAPTVWCGILSTVGFCLVWRRQ